MTDADALARLVSGARIRQHFAPRGYWYEFRGGRTYNHHGIEVHLTFYPDRNEYWVIEED